MYEMGQVSGILNLFKYPCYMRNLLYVYLHVLCYVQLLSYVQLCYLVDDSLPGSSVHGISQARILEWVAMPSSRGSSQPKDRTSISCISLTAGGFFTSEPLGNPFACVCLCII